MSHITAASTGTSKVTRLVANVRQELDRGSPPGPSAHGDAHQPHPPLGLTFPVKVGLQPGDRVTVPVGTNGAAPRKQIPLDDAVQALRAALD